MAFANIGAAGFSHQPFNVWSKDAFIGAPIVGFKEDPNTLQGVSPVYGPLRQVNGFRLVDGRASYGLGLETFALGFPIHFDWSWRTLLNKDYEDIIFSYQALLDGQSSGSRWLRRPKFSVWIGYDF